MLTNVSMVVQPLIPLQTGRSSEKATPRFTYFNKGSYHSRKISLILHHMFAKCLIALSFSTSLGSWQEYCICIQLVVAIVWHHHKTLLKPVPDVWLSLFGKFVCWMNHAFSLDSDPAMSSRSTRTRARTNEWDVTAQHAVSCHYDELHQQKLKFSLETPGGSGRLWRLWRNLVPWDGELYATRHPGDGSRCIHSPLLCGHDYAPSEGHMCYTHRRGCSYAEVVYTMPGDVES